ncbi:TonB-dependent receptor plug domain-containing protein [Imhoffiella purpurea]|uniref:TonB-dependent receptor, plug n=1 Tax=Imhoffiella purpurea TaxID=1249627 RepID=W9VF02_9GAMM|nr:TonB-dependent receptor [Imhoffiella purpurea]EXJ15571.1 TonB-dependent receptor, plug [Imhoffiella purpurea]
MLFGIVLLSPTAVTAAAEGAEDGPLRDLLALLDEETELATRSGMNADFIPGMASILDGEELLLRGARTVWEALSLVPGVAQGLEMTGERQVLSRGVGYSGYTSGNIKLMLDGVPLNSAVMATANALLNLPIEQVERIEVIRGPGASVHGEYAYAGVINVISRKRERRIHVQLGEGGSRGVGGVWYWEDPERDLDLSINFVGVEGEGGAWVDRDALYNRGLESYSYAPGRSNESSRFRSLLVDMSWGGTLVSLQVLNDEYGDYYGAHHYLPPDDDRLATEQRFVTGRISHELILSDTLRADLRAETWRHDRSSDLYLLPAGFMGMESALYVEQDYDEARYQLGADLHWQPNARHQLLLGLEGGRAELLDPPSEHWYTERHRRILSALVQDQFRATERIDLTATVRLDDYSDVGSFVSPRLAGVWRFDDHNIFKLQYARAFRPPTFHDLEYPAEDPVKTSAVSTYEIGYIRKQARWEARLILFQSDLERPVTIAMGGSGFVNTADARLRGVELEYEYRVGPDLKLDLSASYVDARRLDDDESLEGGTDLLANLALLWRPLQDWTAAVQLRYVGERVRALYDARDPLPGYTLADLSLQYRPAARGPFGTLGVKNLTDADYAYPDQSFVGGSHVMPDDYPRPGRTWWLSVGYNF